MKQEAVISSRKNQKLNVYKSGLSAPATELLLQAIYSIPIYDIKKSLKENKTKPNNS